jgi:hypothetical protein
MICGSGIALVVALLSALLFDLLPDMWYAVAVDSISHAVTRRLIYGHAIAEAWSEMPPLLERLWHSPTSAGAVWYVALLGSEFVKTATMHAVPFLAVYFWWHRRRQGAALPASTQWTILFFLIWGSLTFIRPFLRGGDSHHLSQAATPLYFVLVLLLRPLMTRWRETRSLAAGFVACAAIGTVAGVGHRAAIVPMERAVDTLLKETYRVVAPYGTLSHNDRRLAAELEGLLEAVLEHATEKDHVFVVPWSAPAIYALTRRRNPTYYDSMIDLIYRPSEDKQRQVCQALLAKETRLVIGRADLPGAGWDSIGRATQLPVIDACIDKHYERIRDIGRFSVYRRRAVKTESAVENADAPGP